MRPATVNKQSLRDQVTHILRHAILSGEYEPGQRLHEPEVAKHLNVSLTPVREALGTLAGSGLVVRSGRQGTHVRKLNVRDIQNLLSVREILEVLAIRQAVPNLTAEDDTRITKLVEQQERATELARTDPSRALGRLAVLNEEFHQIILERTGNEWLISMLASIQDLLVFARTRLRIQATPERRNSSFEEHRQIAEALIARDTDAATENMSRHVRHLKEHVISLLRELDDDAPRDARAASSDTKPGRPARHRRVGRKAGDDGVATAHPQPDD